MPASTPPYRQAFRVFDPRETEPDIRLDERFRLVVAAPSCAIETEVALGQLFYSMTGIAVDWRDITDLVGASKRTAYGLAHTVPGYGANLPAVQAVITERESAGDRLFIVMQMFSWEQDRLCKLQIVDDLERGVRDTADPNCAFEVNMGRGGEAYTLVVGFPHV